MSGTESINEKSNPGGGEYGIINNCPLKGRPNDVPEREATKRLAHQGQWRTPPLPAFAAAYVKPTSAADSSIPTTPDEYARMLQEAYKRGAAAGARAQQPTKQPMPMGTPPPSVTVQYAPHQGTAQGVASNIQVSNTNYSARAQHPIPTSVPSTSSGESGAGRTASVPVSHSKSLPDMTSYQATLTYDNEEEDKRKKRLARNRASARLRRLKKKNLVDSYEGEVGILESALSKLRSHRWGLDATDHEALFEALSMERGQQPLTPEKRRELIQSIVAQQREQVDNLLECQLENWMLCTLANPNDNLMARGTQSSTNETPADGSNLEEELTQVTSELKSILQLTPQQQSLLEQSSLGCVHEVQDLFTVGNCLQSIHANQWLLDEGVDEIAGKFTSILNPTQLSKFLLWSDHNAEPIEKLDYANAVTTVGNGPVFEFGVDEGLADGD